jgi:hypothetical protein
MQNKIKMNAHRKMTRSHFHQNSTMGNSARHDQIIVNQAARFLKN